MKNRSFFVAGALLLASLFTTSCKELASNFDQPVKSYLTVNVADMTIPTGDTDTIKASSINSDKPITYKSSDESVAIVDENGVVTGVADGEATITVSVEASENYLAGEQEVKVAVKRPLTFEALEDGQINVYYNNGITLPEPIKFSINKGAKQSITNSTVISVSKGDIVEFESANDHTADYGYFDYGGYGYWTVRYVQIQPQSQCAVYGNVMSMITPDGNYHTNKTITQDYALYNLLYGYSYFNNDNVRVFNTIGHDKYKLLFPATTLTYECYGMTLAYTGITEAPELPATELADYCYYNMFRGCSYLTKAPKLPATTLKYGCYYAMFQNCDLSEVPELPAKKLEPYCYAYLVQGNANITKAPALPITKLEPYCYAYMLAGTGISEVPNLPATKLEPYCYAGLVRGCTNISKAPELPITKLEEGCYSYMLAQTSITEAPELPATKMEPYCYQGMFNYCQNLTKAPELKSTQLADNCYASMFYGCNALTTAPELPATNLAYRCYYRMFYYCSALTTAPELPATTLAEECYNQMFYRCSSLENAPVLPALELPYRCYYRMFYYCSNLKYVKCLATSKLDGYALYQWMRNAGTNAETRTFVHSADNNNWVNNNGNGTYTYQWYVPTGWTITVED